MTASVPAPVEAHPATVPLYTPWDVARYFHVPVWSVALMTGWFREWPPPEWFFRRRRWLTLPSADDDPRHPGWLRGADRLSFAQAADLFVLSAAFRLVEDEDADERLCHAVVRGLEGPSYRQVGESRDGWLDRAAGRFGLDPAETSFLRKWLGIHQDRVEFSGADAVRLFPFTRDPAEGSPRSVVLDPRVRFGQPTLAGRGLPTDSVMDRYWAGDGVAELAADYGVRADEIEEAVRYESLPASGLNPMSDW
ncbi:MAG: DUF433 domain-containing protein [Gemmataceae bacterium]